MSDPNERTPTHPPTRGSRQGERRAVDVPLHLEHFGGVVAAPGLGPGAPSVGTAWRPSPAGVVDARVGADK